MSLQYPFYQIGFIDFFTMLKNISVRFVSRILPNGLRSYKRIMRSKLLPTSPVFDLYSDLKRFVIECDNKRAVILLERRAS